MRRILPASAAIVLVVAGLGACDSETEPGSPIPTGTGVGESGFDTTTGSLPPQMTAAPNPAAGGDGAPTPATSGP